MSLRDAVDQILLDLEYSTGPFEDDSLMRDERRDLAAELIVQAVSDAGYGPHAYAGA